LRSSKNLRPTRQVPTTPSLLRFSSMTDLELREVAERYRQMSEPELMDVARKYDGLTEPAKAILRDEFARRSLQPPLIEEESEDVIESRPLVTVRKYRDLPEAFVARSVLESAGIECFLQDENTVRMDWFWSNMIGGARLQVAAEDEAAAKEILSQPMPASFPVDAGADFEQPKCPQCGSLNVVGDNINQKIAIASMTAFGAPMVVGLPAMAMQPDDVWKCLDCGCLWQTDDEPDPEASTPVN
jgi:Putative prokaryotic signal transducing protein